MPKRCQKPVPEDPPIPKRVKNHKTAKSPWEASREEEYEVERIEGKNHEKVSNAHC